MHLSFAKKNVIIHLNDTKTSTAKLGKHCPLLVTL